MPSLKYKELTSDTEAESSREIKKRVDEARKVQDKRFIKEGIYFNSQMNHKQIKKFCKLNDAAGELLKTAIQELDFPARAYDKILKVSRTISDLADSEFILQEYISEP